MSDSLKSLVGAFTMTRQPIGMEGKARLVPNSMPFNVRERLLRVQPYQGLDPSMADVDLHLGLDAIDLGLIEGGNDPGDLGRSVPNAKPSRSKAVRY
jgi:hypothetical protein